MSSVPDLSSAATWEPKSSVAHAAEFEKYRNRIRHIVRARLHPLLLRRLDAEDVVQEIFLTAQQRLEQWKQEKAFPFFVWLRQITIQTIQNFHRYHLHARRRTLLQEQHGDECTSSWEPIARVGGRSSSSPSQAAIRREAVSALEEALQNLSDNDREIISLRNFECLSNTEVAACLGISEKAASIRYIRALDRLRVELNRKRDY